MDDETLEQMAMTGTPITRVGDAIVIQGWGVEIVLLEDEYGNPKTWYLLDTSGG